MDFNNDKNDNNYIPSPVDTQAAGVPDTKTWQKNRAGSNTQSPSTPDINSSWKTSKKEMKAAGVKTDPMTGEYTQAQIDDWNKNKSTSKGLESNKTNGVKMDTEASQLEKAQTKLNNQGSDTKNSVQATEDSLDSSITSNNSDLKKNAEDFYNNKQTQTQTNELSNTKYPELDENDDPATTSKVKDFIEGSIDPSDNTPAGEQAKNKAAEGSGSKVNPDGTITPPTTNPFEKDDLDKYDPSKTKSEFEYADKSEKVLMAATALSLIISIATMGHIPPINFTRILGVDKRYDAYLNQIDKYNTTVMNPAVAKVKMTEAENKNAGLVDDYVKTHPDAYKTFAEIETLIPAELKQQEAEYQKLVIETQNSADINLEKTKEKMASQLFGDELAYFVKLYDEGKITQEGLQNYAYALAAKNGQTKEYVDAKVEGLKTKNVSVGIGKEGLNVETKQGAAN